MKRLASDPQAEQVAAAQAIVEAVLPPGVVRGAHLYGSAVVGGLRPDSDLDLLVLTDRRLTVAEKRALLEALVPISSRASRPEGWRPLELTVVVVGEVRPWRRAGRIDFQYGEWLRAELLDGNLEAGSGASSDVPVLIAMVRSASRTLIGPAPAELLDPVPSADLVHAMLDAVPGLLADLGTDTRNVLLTLARIWVTVATGELVSKDVAADWAAARLPVAHRGAMTTARRAYLGVEDDRWDDLSEARAAADLVVAMIGTAARPESTALPARDASD